MTQIISHIPKIRFKEFSGEWEEKKLGEVSENIKSGKSQNNDLGNYDLYGSTGIIGKCENYSNDGNYILVARVGANAGSLNLVNGKFGVTDNTLIIDLDNKTNIGFIYNFLYNFNLNKLVFGSGQPLVTGTQLKNIKLNLPSFPEQQKIASFLSSVDEKIEKIKEKKKNLEEYKKGVMQKIFSQEIRFKDKNGEEFEEWEEKQLEECILDISDGGTPSTTNSNYFGGNINWTVIEDIKDKIFKTKQTLTNEGFKACSSRLWKPGTIILSTGATIGNVGITYVETGTKQGICGIVVNNKTLNIFLKFWFQFNKNELLKKAQGSSIKEIRPPELKKLKINLPTLKEQEKIADLLSGIDEKIEKVSDELEKMEEFKKGLLQGMFV